MKPVAFDDWEPSLDEALQHIPELEDYPHALIKMLARHQAGRKKKLWLITENGSPVALAPLRKAGAFVWQPVTQYILPGMIVPGIDGRIFDALDSIGANLRIALWRTAYGIPDRRQIYDTSTTKTYGIDCSEDFEAYWKSTDIWRHLRSARNKWKGLTLKENAPGASEWIISSWAKKFGVAEDETQDRLLAARFLEDRGKHFSLTLYDGDRALAGQTCLSHRGEMIGQCLYRESHDSGVGNRLLHQTFCWAQEKGFKAIDIGGGHDYKRKFAPPRAERHEFTMSPLLSYVSEQAYSKTRWRLQSLVNSSRAVLSKK